MKNFRIQLAVLVFSASLFADTQDKISQIKIFIPDRESLTKVWSTGIDYEGSSGKIGGWMEFIAGPFERQALSMNGISYQIINDDISVDAARAIRPEPVNALGFGYGTMGGYYTYQEVLQQLDSMKFLFPGIITERESIGTTHQGRAIWAVKISDNPDLPEDNEPEALYTALHHAREPEGMMALLYYMWWLLENYDMHQDAAYLVNNRQMWFIPVVNPDGYVYNQTTNPAGGGMWRKNRRNNGTSYGVDLNRNYGPYEMWDGPNGGSSTNPASETYRGPAPFSEPEISSIANFLWSNNIRTCLNYHTYGNYLIYPWGYLARETDDSLRFREFAFDMTAENRYTAGTDQQTVNYSTRGNSDDFMYNGTFNRTFAMTPEVSTLGFWPPSDQILPLAVENLSANKYCSYIAGQYSLLKSFEILDTDGDGLLSPGENFSLAATIRNKGLGDASSLLVTISSSVTDVGFTDRSASISLLPSGSDTVVNFTGDVRNDPALLARIQLLVTTEKDDGYLHTDTISVCIGQPVIIFADSADGGMSNWTTTGTWNTSPEAHTPPSSFTDSPSGNYFPGANYSLTLKNPVNLFGYEYCVLKFWTKWSIEPTFDFGTVEVSTDGGGSWNYVRSRMSRPGSGRGRQASGSWGYDFYNPGLDWTEQEVDLSQFVDNQLTFRFRIESDGSNERDGWYLDDIRVAGFRLPLPRVQIADQGSGFDFLIFGENPFGTDGIDTLLGETELLPKPGPGVFDVRWNIQGTNGTHSDFRAPLDEVNPSNIYLLDFQPGPAGYPITIKWDPERLSGGGWQIRDANTNGSLIDLDMWSDTSLTIQDISVQTIEIVHTINDTIYVGLNPGWSLISAPMITENMAKRTLYPGAVTDAFAYDGNYAPKDTLEYGRGYWIKYNYYDTVRLAGVPIVRETIVLPAGWSIVGGLACPIPVDQMECSPSPCQPQVYRSGYVTPPVIYPNEGFWMKGPKTVFLSGIRRSPQPITAGKETGFLNGLNTITVSDHNESSAVLYFGNGENCEVPLHQFDLPPAPPSGSFDARFSSQRSVELFSSLPGGSKEASIEIQTSAYPLEIRWRIGEEKTNKFELTCEKGNERILSGEGSILITDPEVTSLWLRQVVHAAVPDRFALKDNFPNPFNPSTTIEFEIPLPSVVSLELKNVLGQDVRPLIETQYFDAGRYSRNFDGSALSTGLYFYQLTARPLNGSPEIQLIKKMVLIK